MSTTIIVTEQIPGMKCTCMTVGNDCSNTSTARYNCEISDAQMIQSQVTQSVAKGIQITSYSAIILGFILFPLFILIAVARLVFFLKKSERLKTTFKISSISFLIVLVLYFGGYYLKLLAP